MTLKELILFCYAMVAIFFSDPVSIQSGPCGIVTDQKVLSAMYYHGILYSYEDETGEYFIRGGKRCRLFTNAFMKKWERRRTKNEKTK